MPNYCSYEMRVRGKKESIATLYEWLNAGYNYMSDSEIKCYTLKEGATRYDYKEEDKIPCKHHIGYRVFDCYMLTPEIEEDYTTLYGDCAWSVACCMFPGGYMADNSNDNEERYAISLEDACKELELDVEVFSEEMGMCFSEHYYIEKGELLVDECVDYQELEVAYYLENKDAYDELPPKLQWHIDNAEEEWIRVSDNINEDEEFLWAYIGNE